MRSIRQGSAAPAVPLMLGCLVALLASSGCREEPVVEELLRPVRTTLAAATDGERTRTFVGVTQASEESTLSFRVPGTLAELNVSVGSPVRAGQVIGALESADYELRLQEARASLAQAEASARSARSEYDRVRSLYETENASKSDLDRARGQAESSAAAQRAVAKRVEQAQKQVSYTKLAAPTDGVVSAVAVERGENVGAGQRIVVVSSGDRLQVLVAIPEALVAQIEANAPVSISLDAIAEQSFPARVTEVGVTASAGTTYPVVATFEAPVERVRPGMAAKVAFTFRSSGPPGRFILPAVSVGEDREGRFVFVVKPDAPGTAIVQRRAVTVGDLTSEGLEILSGIASGEHVVTAGTRRIQDGLRVRFTQPTQDVP